MRHGPRARKSAALLVSLRADARPAVPRPAREVRPRARAQEVIAVGFTLQPEVAFLELCDELIRHDVDYYEVAPETLWRGDDQGRLEPNGFHRRFLALRAETDCFF